MKKSSKQPRWVTTLRAIMEARGYNPRNLSLRAGLNATAVRDILEGRAKYPRYDTIEALSKALTLTPDQLMNGKSRDLLRTEKMSKAEKEAQPAHTQKTPASTENILETDDLELLTDIISQLQEVADEYKQALKPKDFAAMVSTIFSHLQDPETDTKRTELHKPIKQLMTYERLRKQAE